MASPTYADTDHAGTPGHWRLVIVLMAVYTYAFIDRVILALLVDPIKADLGASDIQMGLLLGLAFAVFYGVFSVPAGDYVDRFNRRRLIGVASIAWAAMTVVCGTSTTLAQLFAGRMGVGIAEAVIAPAAFSLIRDAVPSHKRGLAFSIFAMSPIIGGAASLIFGGALLKAAANGGFAGVPLLGALAPWQATLVIVGLSGLPFSLLLLLLKEPARQTLAGTGEQRVGMFAGLVLACRYMIGRSAVFLPLVVFAAFGAMMSFSKSSWLPTGFGRRWELAPQDYGPVLGSLTLVMGVLGLFFAGFVMNRIAQRGGDIRVYGAVAALATGVGVAGAILAPSPTAGYVFAACGLFFLGCSYAVGATTLAAVTPVALMGRVTAVYLLFQNLIGQALGPLVVAWSASAFAGPMALPYGLSLSMLAFATVTALSAIVLGRAIARASGVR